MKDISKIIQSAINVFNNVKLKEDISGTYALEFTLILLGEKANSIIEKFKKFCRENPSIFDELNKVEINFDRSKLTDDQSFNQEFRTMLSNTPLGKFLMTLNRIRNHLDHHIQNLEEKHHREIGKAVKEFDLICEIFNELKNIFDDNISDVKKIKKLLTAESEDVDKLDALFKTKDVLDGVNKEMGKKRKNKRKKNKDEQIEQQHKTILFIADNLLLEISHIKYFATSQLSDRVSLYATCMAIISLGAQAGVLINTKLQQENVSPEVKLVITKFKNELKELYDARSGLAHLSYGLPSKAKVEYTAKNAIEQEDTLNNFLVEIGEIEHKPAQKPLPKTSLTPLKKKQLMQHKIKKKKEGVSAKKLKEIANVSKQKKPVSLDIDIEELQVGLGTQTKKQKLGQVSFKKDLPFDEELEETSFKHQSSKLAKSQNKHPPLLKSNQNKFKEKKDESPLSFGERLAILQSKKNKPIAPNFEFEPLVPEKLDHSSTEEPKDIFLKQPLSKPIKFQSKAAAKRTEAKQPEEKKDKAQLTFKEKLATINITQPKQKKLIVPSLTKKDATVTVQSSKIKSRKDPVVVPAIFHNPARSSFKLKQTGYIASHIPQQERGTTSEVLKKRKISQNISPLDFIKERTKKEPPKKTKHIKFDEEGDPLESPESKFN